MGCMYAAFWLSVHLSTTKHGNYKRCITNRFGNGVLKRKRDRIWHCVEERMGLFFGLFCKATEAMNTVPDKELSPDEPR